MGKHEPFPLVFLPPGSGRAQPPPTRDHAPHAGARLVWFGAGAAILVVTMGAAWPKVSGWTEARRQAASVGSIDQRQTAVVSFAESDVGASASNATGTSPDASGPPGGMGLNAFAPGEAAPVPIKEVDPVYPSAARAAGVEGLVVVSYSVDRNGRPVDLTVVKSVPLLDEAVLLALRQWEYTRPTSDVAPFVYRYHAEFVLNDGR